MNFLPTDEIDFDKSQLNMSIELSMEDEKDNRFDLNKLVKPSLQTFSCPSFQSVENINELFKKNLKSISKSETEKPINIDSLITKKITKKETIKPFFNPEPTRSNSITGEFLSQYLKNESRKPLNDCTNTAKNSLSINGKVKRKMDLDSTQDFATLFNSEMEDDVFCAQSLPELPVNQKQNVLFRRIYSETTISKNIKPVKPVDKSTYYIGDLSRPYSLPIMNMVRDELVYITSETMASVLEKHHPDYLIIDCRYPYEYEGGHIKNAINIYTQQSLLDYFFENNKMSNISLIFHCEYSQHRGPSMARCLRNRDRYLHCQNYPKLFYPEIYVLNGGYRDFFNSFPHLCSPMAYVEMNDSNFTKQYAKFKRESKSNLGREIRSAIISHH